MLSNSSQYTLATVNYRDDEHERSSLLSNSSTSSYGTAPLSPTPPNRKRVIVNAALKMGVIFTLGCLVLGGTLWLALPRLEECVFVALWLHEC